MSERPRQVLGHLTWGAHTHHPGTAVWLALRPLALAVSSQSLSSVHAPLVSGGGEPLGGPPSQWIRTHTSTFSLYHLLTGRFPITATLGIRASTCGWEGGGRALGNSFQAQEAAGVQARWLDGGERQCRSRQREWGQPHRACGLPSKAGTSGRLGHAAPCVCSVGTSQ